MNKKIRFTVGSCGECPAYSYSAMFCAGYCDKMRKPVDDAGKILDECPNLKRKPYYSKRKRHGITDNLGYPIIKKIMEDKKITLTKMAQDLHLDKGYLSRVLRYNILRDTDERYSLQEKISVYLGKGSKLPNDLFPENEQAFYEYLLSVVKHPIREAKEIINIKLPESLLEDL